MGRRFAPARFAGQGAPEVQSMVYDSAQTFLEGAVLIMDSDGEVIEASADPTSAIIGVALEDYDSKPGYDAANSPSTFTGRVREVSVAKANRSTIFSGRLVDTNEADVAPDQANVGIDYAIVKVSNDWCVDESDEVNVSVRIVDFDATDSDNYIVFFRFLDSVLHEP